MERYKTYENWTTETHENWTTETMKIGLLKHMNIGQGDRKMCQIRHKQGAQHHEQVMDMWKEAEVFCVSVPNQFSSINGVETWNFSHVHSPGAESGRF